MPRKVNTTPLTADDRRRAAHHASSRNRYDKDEDQLTPAQRRRWKKRKNKVMDKLKVRR